MKTLTKLLILGLTFNPMLHLAAQITDAAVIKPIHISKSTLSGVGLKKVNLKDQPGREFFQKNLFRGKDLSVYVVSSESWKAPVTNFPFDEYVYMLNGNASVTDSLGTNYTFNSFDHFFAPKGLTGEWEILAADNYHYELSVIATRRSAGNLKSKKLSPQLLDRKKLSGAVISLGKEGTYEEVLVSGDELKITIKAEAPRETRIEQSLKEQIIRVLSGQISIEDASGDSQTFFTGESFIVPQGVIGIWKSEGHGIVKYLCVEKAG